jgi:hypothetical protein
MKTNHYDMISCYKEVLQEIKLQATVDAFFKNKVHSYFKNESQCVCADGVIGGKHKYHKERHKLDASKAVGLDISTQKTKYMLSCHNNAGKNQNTNTDNRSFENVA